MSMCAPVQATRVSSEYGIRAGKKHGGIDIACAPDAPVFASFAGTVSNVVSGRRRWQPADEGTVVAVGRTGDGCRVNNPDGEVQVYIHMRPIVAEGQKVKRGQLIGYVNLSGNTSGWHLHFETWSAARMTRNPRLYFTANGITPLTAPEPYVEPPVVPPPVAPPATGDPGVRGVQEVLRILGYYRGNLDGVNGPMTIAAVRQYQINQNTFGKAGLLADGDWGPRTQAWYSWVGWQAQPALNHFIGVQGQVRANGDYSSAFADQVRTVQRRNGLKVDGVLGNVMTRWMRSKGSSVRDRP